MSQTNNTDKQKRILIVVAIILVVLGSSCFGYWLFANHGAENDGNKISSVTSTTAQEASEKLVDNPIDFKSLQKKNSDIYAWINVPGTKVDYPVVQHESNNDFYLKHSAIDKSWVASGAIYSEMINTISFEDRVTLLYGHNGYSDTMFTTLHKFENKDFFDKNEYFYIYTPTSKLTYKIVSAFKYDDRHIMNSFDFQNDDIFLEFLEMIQNPVSSKKNTRQNIGWELTTDDKVVVLSTCITHQKSSRYLVCGVLEKNEKTN